MIVSGRLINVKSIFCRTVFQYMESNIAYRNNDLTNGMSVEEL